MTGRGGQVRERFPCLEILLRLLQGREDLPRRGPAFIYRPAFSVGGDKNFRLRRWTIPIELVP